MASRWAPRTRRWWRIGRLQLGFRLYIHHYVNAPDRWVFQPEVVYDRKAR